MQSQKLDLQEAFFLKIERDDSPEGGKLENNFRVIADD